MLSYKDNQTKDLCTVRYSSTSKKGLLFCDFEVCWASSPSYLHRLWSSKVLAHENDSNILTMKIDLLYNILRLNMLLVTNEDFAIRTYTPTT